MKSLSKKRIRTLAMQIIHDVFPNNQNGFSLNPITGRKISFTPDTYFVSKKGHELRCSEAGVSLSIVQAWLLKNKSILANCRYFLGEWYDSDTNEYVFDVSTKKNGYIRAMDYAKNQNQTSIYHPFSDIAYKVDCGKVEVA